MCLHTAGGKLLDKLEKVCIKRAAEKLPCISAKTESVQSTLTSHHNIFAFYNLLASFHHFRFVG